MLNIYQDPRWIREFKEALSMTLVYICVQAHSLPPGLINDHSLGSGLLVLLDSGFD